MPTSVQKPGNRLAFVFPGQGSQTVGMLSDFASRYKIVQQTFSEASTILEYDLWDLISNGPESRLNRTEITQPALLTAGVAIWRTWLQAGGTKPDYLAGHSLGEFTALVCSGVLRFNDAVSLVRDRGRYMQEAVPAGTGGMAAVLGLESGLIEKLCQQAETGEVVTPANYNSPEQTVIAGHIHAVSRIAEQCKAAGAKRVIMLPVSVPSHCLLMKSASLQLEQRLKDIVVSSPEIPVLHNIDAQSRIEPDDIRSALVKQLHHPVRWVDTINHLGQLHCHTIFESGPGKVLTGLIKRIDREISATAINDADTLEQQVKDSQP